MTVYPSFDKKKEDESHEHSNISNSSSETDGMLDQDFPIPDTEVTTISSISGLIRADNGGCDFRGFDDYPKLKTNLFTPLDPTTVEQLYKTSLAKKLPKTLDNTIVGLNYTKTNDDYEVDTKSESLKDKSSDLKSLEAAQSTQASNETLVSNYIKKEKGCSIALQVAIPFFIAGFGTIGAGLVLGKVEKFQVFNEISALIILVPAIIGLKGNLDMCLASRLSTQANLGNLKGKKEIMKMIFGNLGLVQVQAIVAATLVSFYAVGMGALVSHETLSMKQILFVICCSVMTATTSCLVLDMFLIGVIFLSKKLKKNPDYVATPLAASIGDVLSLGVLSFTAGRLYLIYHTHYWIFFVIGSFYSLIALPFWIYVVKKSKYTRKLLTKGWTPVFSALFISGLSGLVLDKAVDNFRGFVVFQPIINGIGGNLVSVQSSRISTMLHQTSLPGILAPTSKCLVTPYAALFKGAPSAKTARILIAMNIPGQILFVTVADVIYNRGTIAITPQFMLTYLSVSLLQLTLLLYIAHIIIHVMWKFKIDPDNCAIPILTALGDLFGSSLLLLAFIFVSRIDYEYTPV